MKLSRAVVYMQYRVLRVLLPAYGIQYIPAPIPVVRSRSAGEGLERSRKDMGRRDCLDGVFNTEWGVMIGATLVEGIVHALGV